MTPEHISTLHAPEVNTGTLTPVNPTKRGVLFADRRAGTAGSPNSHKSRFINRAGTLHPVTHSSPWHWSNPKCSYSTQCSTHSTCHIAVGGRRGHTARKQQSCIKLRGTQLYKFSSAQHPRVCYSPRGAESTVHSQTAFLLVSKLQLDGLSGLNTHTKVRVPTSASQPCHDAHTQLQAHTHTSPVVQQGCIESYNCNSQKCEEKNQQRHRYLGSRQCYFPPSRQQS